MAGKQFLVELAGVVFSKYSFFYIFLYLIYWITSLIYSMPIYIIDQGIRIFFSLSKFSQLFFFGLLITCALYNDLFLFIFVLSIQLSYGTLVVIFRCPPVPEIITEGPLKSPSTSKAEKSPYNTYSVGVK